MEHPDHSQLTDSELVELYRQGDTRGFEVLLGRYEKPLLRFAARYDPSRAQDIVQEVFLRLVREPAKLDGVENVSAWLYRVARNQAIDESRKETRMARREQLAAVPEAGTAASSSFEVDEMADLVATKLMGLPPRQRDVLILKIQESKTYREIGEVTGLSTSNVGYLIHQGLRTLACELRLAGVL